MIILLHFFFWMTFYHFKELYKNNFPIQNFLLWEISIPFRHKLNLKRNVKHVVLAQKLDN